MPNLKPEQQVNTLGKYIYKHTYGAYKINFSTMNCDVFVIMYYQIPGEPETLEEMKFDINLTTYQNKVRVNVTELTEYEKTIGQSVWKPEELVDIQSAYTKVYDKICYQIEREYQDYDFVF